MSKSYDIKRGVGALKTREVWKRVGGVALGSLAAGVGASLGSKIAPDSIGRSGKYAAGSLVGAVVAIGCFAFDFQNAGVGAAAITVNYALNTVTTLVSDKSVSELVA
jgi:hypothetical protein